MSGIADCEITTVPTRLHVQLFGKFSLRLNEKKIHIPSRKARALFGYLALSGTGEETRDRIVGIFWSESDQDKARASLRQATREIRSIFTDLKFDGFSATKHAITLDLERVQVDVSDLINTHLDNVAAQLLAEKHLADQLFLDLETVDSSFQTWVMAKRQALCNQLTRQLEDTLQNTVLADNIREKSARALINLDPTHEEAVRELMKLRMVAGDIGGALGAYKDLWKILDEEYEVEPSPTTQNLVVEMKLGEHSVDSSSSIMAAESRYREISQEISTQPGEISQPRQTVVSSWKASKLLISISKFDTLGIPENLQYLVQAFERELITSLVRFREWSVRDARSTGAPSPPGFKDTHEFVIEGSTIEGNKSLHFVLMLRDPYTGEYLWSENVELSVENWFHAQRTLVRRIATELNVHVSVGRMRSIVEHSVSDLKAFDVWLLGQATFLSFDPKQWDKAAALFEKVINEMPNFAPAYSSLAQINNSHHIVMPGIFRDAKRTAQALTYAREAVRLDPIDSRSQLCLGWSHAMAKQHEQAMIHIPLAIQLNGNDPWTMISAANCFAFCGHYDQAREIANSVVQLPMATGSLHWSYHVAIRFMCADYVGCIDAANFVADLNPNVPGYKAAALFHLGRTKEAREELGRFFEIARSRWIGEEMPTEWEISRWFLTMFPIADHDDWVRLRDGFAGAGAPTDGLHHNQW